MIEEEKLLDLFLLLVLISLLVNVLEEIIKLGFLMEELGSLLLMGLLL